MVQFEKGSIFEASVTEVPQMIVLRISRYYFPYYVSDYLLIQVSKPLVRLGLKCVYRIN